MKTIIQLSLALTVAVMSMVITACGSDDDPVTESPSLSVPVRNYSVAQNGETLKISLSTNQTNISVDVAEDGKGWIHPSSITHQSVSLIVDKREEVAPRTATETTVNPKDGKYVLVVSGSPRRGGNTDLLADEFARGASEAGGNVYIDTESNFKYEVNIDVDWIQEVSNDSRALSKSTIALYIHPNENYDSREATITLCDPSSQDKKTLTIVQAQKNAIVLAKHFYEIEKDGGEMTFDVGANVDYDIQVDASWISQKTSRALSYKQVTFVISPNYSEVERTATISFANKNIDMVQTITIKQKIGNAINGHGYVDLGLPSGLKWATCNVGADAPESYGDYYQWGEVTTHYSAGGNTDNPTWKDGYSAGYNWSTYKWCNGSDKTLTKYVPQSKASDYGYEGFYDDKVTLEKADDVASQTWGGSWVVPTPAQQEELYNECYWVWTNSYNGTGVHGYIVYKAKADDDKGTIVYDGNTPSSSYSLSDVHIFLPAAGYRWDTNLSSVGYYGDYWSNSLSEDGPAYAWDLYFDTGYVSPWGVSSRYCGFSVRPVCHGAK